MQTDTVWFKDDGELTKTICEGVKFVENLCFKNVKMSSQVNDLNKKQKSTKRRVKFQNVVHVVKLNIH